MAVALVVLAEDKIRKKIQKIFEGLEFTVLVAKSCTEARSCLAESGMDFLVLGTSFSDGDGLDLLVELRAQSPTDYLPIIIIAEKVTDNLLKKALKGRADDVLVCTASDDVIRAVAASRFRVKSLYDGLTKEIEKTRQEMDMARKVQEQLLPSEYPDTDKVRFAARYVPAEGVGGDFYDIISHEDESVGLFISDVSGHGIHAAFTTMSIKTALNTWARGIVSPSETFILINNLVLGIVDIGRFVTAFYGKLDLDTMEFIYSNAGHPPTLLYRAGVKKPELLDTETGFPLGISAESVYQEKVVQLAGGDKLFLFTDGVTEARSVDNDLYGDDRFMDLLAANIGKDVDAILDAVLDDLKEFAKGTVFFDDINLIGIEIV
jgi:sigma-B regulation protein RsbU (phosphoserine phosphatase)